MTPKLFGAQNGNVLEMVKKYTSIGHFDHLNSISAQNPRM